MSTTVTSDELTGAEAAQGEGPVLERRRMPEDSEIDMTPMIDCVFLLNIFFILTFNSDPSKSSLPPSVTGTTIDPRIAVVVTIAEAPDSGAPLIYLGQGKQGSPLPADEASQREILLDHLQKGRAEGKTVFNIQGDRAMKGGDMTRIMALVNEVEGMTIALSVQEIEP
jgi:biopolymer transport protein ExbD